MAGSHETPSAPWVNILLVDDQPANLLALEAILQGVKANLVRAQSGDEALRQVLEHDFAVILMDVRMPGLDGYETARLIRSRERSRQTPLIFITAHETSDAVVLQAFKDGAADHLIKPLVPDILRAKVAGFVELSQKEEQIRRQAEALRELERRQFDHRLTEEKQRWELERLREETRHKDEFLAILGHELRNPLAPLRNAVQILRHTELASAAAEQAREMIERQVQHLTRLVDDLLDVSRVTSGRIALHKKQVQLQTVVRQAIEMSRPQIDENSHELTVALPAEPLWLEGDPERLTQILTNLLLNAAKYTEAPGHIWLSAEPAGTDVRMRVRDTGVGIDPEMQQRIFDLFVQENHAPNSAFRSGLGIGLTLVKSLVELHGGHITVQSPGRGQGSEFQVRLPLLPAPTALPVSGASEPALPPVRSRRVLVVDDNQDAAESLALMLELEGHQVWRAHDGAAALECAQVFPPEVVLLDIGLPGGMDGYEVARRLRQQSGLEEVLLVAVTGFGQGEDRRRSLEAGINYHLTKPVEPAELQRLLLTATCPPHA